MYSALTIWNTKIEDSSDHLHSSLMPSFPNIHIRDALFVIGLITVCLLVFILLIRFLIKVREAYQTTVSKSGEENKRSSYYRATYASYQELSNTGSKQCECFQDPCCPRCQCTKPTYQILNQSPYYEQIDERQINDCG